MPILVHFIYFLYVLHKEINAHIDCSGIHCIQMISPQRNVLDIVTFSSQAGLYGVLFQKQLFTLLF